MTIYIVTSGSYSAYHIETAFSAKEAADEYAQHMWDGEVEEVEVDAEYPQLEKARRGFYMYTIFFDDAGNVRRPIHCGTLVGNNPYVIREMWKPGIRVAVEAKDEEHAIKAASEMRAQFLAQERGA